MQDVATNTEQLGQEQQTPQPPKKLKVGEFAAKIKLKYPEYKDTPDDVLVDKIVTKYPEYKSQVDIPLKKNETPPQPLPSNSVGGQLPAPKVDETQIQAPQIAPQPEEKPFDPIQASFEYKDLKEKGTPVQVMGGSSFGMGVDTQNTIDTNSQQKAEEKKTKEDSSSSSS